MRSRLTAAMLAGSAVTAAGALADPPKPGWFTPPPVRVASRPYDVGTARILPAARAPDDILVERWRALPPVRPEPEHRDVFESDPVLRSMLDDRLASTRSGYGGGCRAGSVCYGNGPGLLSVIGKIAELLR